MDTYRVDVGLGGVSKHAPVERLVRWHEGERGYKVETNNEYGYRPLHRPRTFCGECGSQSGRADDETLSQRFAVSVVDNLVDRLQERDVDINYTAVRYCVKKLKSKPETKDYDTEIFERATKLGIKRARYNSR